VPRFALLFFCAAVAGLAFPSAFDEYRAKLAAESAAEALDAPAATVRASAPAASPPPGTASLVAGPDGHFRTEARINGRAVDVLVDTGATYVAMNEAEARRLGVAVAPADFRYESETANGRARVALATLDRVRIGTVEVRNVEVAVMKGDGLGGVLLGMSFMGKLKRYDVAAGRLNLVR
jgi:aspartyl protease family protein